jgi:hypothetical protein
VRKLRRRSDWGQAGDDLAQRVRDAVAKVFRSQAEPEISTYFCHSDEDLRRVALGMNAGRDKLNEPVPFVAFLLSEFEALGIQATQTPGALPCAHANRLHYDILATDNQLGQLCETAMNDGRIAGNCSSGMMNDTIKEATKEKCRTVTQDGNCLVANCHPTA